MRTHRFEPVSLVFGLIFAGSGLAFLTSDVDLWRVNWSWFWPLALTAAGVLMLASARTGRRTADDEDQTTNIA